MDQSDVIVVGGGHNGLVAAGYLARAGLSVVVLEKNAKVGGLAITDEIFPGYKFNTFGHHFGYFQPKILDDLEIMKRGLKVCPIPDIIKPFYDGKYMFEFGKAFAMNESAPERMLDQISKFSPHDAERYRDWMLMWLEASSVFRANLFAPPPSLAELSESLKGTDEEDAFYRVMMTSQKDLLDEHFESDEVKAATAYVIEGPPSSAAMNMFVAFIIAATADVQIRDLDGYLQGGMGSLTQALSDSAQEKGVQIKTDATVESIMIKEGSARGVVLSDGQTLNSRAVLSNLDPRTTFLNLVGSDHLEQKFVEKTKRIHSKAGYMRMHCVIDRIPKWRVLPSHEGVGAISPSLEYMEKAWDDASYGRVVKEPIISLRMPCLNDPTMAPSGKYGMEVWVQYAPVHPNLGSWDKIREDVGNQLIDFIDEWIIDFKKSLLKWRLYTPLDIERWANVSEGHMCHMDLTTDQMLFMRPLLGWSNYRTPINGLYLCGSGTHGGGAVTGIPGHNGAHALLEDWTKP